MRNHRKPSAGTPKRTHSGSLVAQIVDAAQYDPADAASGLAASQRAQVAARRAVCSGIDPAQLLAHCALAAAGLLSKLPDAERSEFLSGLQNPRVALARRAAEGK